MLQEMEEPDENPMKLKRVIALIDMDCFYVQVEERFDPSIKGVPAAVLQYKKFMGGAIIAVNYEARAKGVTRSMKGDEAKNLCPEIVFARVPEVRGKACLERYREAGAEVIETLTKFSSTVERASVDEAYIDLSDLVEERLRIHNHSPEDAIQSIDHQYLEENHVFGHTSNNNWIESLQSSEIPRFSDIKLLIGAEIVGKMRKAILDSTGFKCSAGIAHNKVLAKLVCGVNKPNKQTILSHRCVPELWRSTQVKKVRNLGGKLGDILVDSLKCNLMSDLFKYSEKDLQALLGDKSGSWIYNLAMGYDDEEVINRRLPKSIGCSKNFLGRETLKTNDSIKYWLKQLSVEVADRLNQDMEKNNRTAKTLTLHVRFINGNVYSKSVGGIYKYDAEKFSRDAYATLEKLLKSGNNGVNSLGLIASNFEEKCDISSCSKISTLFRRKEEKSLRASAANANQCSLTLPNSSNCSAPSTSLATENFCDYLDDMKESNESKNKTNDMSNHSIFSEPGTSTVRNKRTSDQPTFFFYDPNKKQSSLLEAKARLSPKKRKEEVTEICEKCQAEVPIQDILMHLDDHYARDLHRELNGLPQVTFTHNNEPKVSKNDKATKRKLKKGLYKKSKSSNKESGMKTLDSFLVPKSA